MNIREVIRELRTKLPDYLAEHFPTVDMGKNFCCVSPTHDDTTPSMSRLPDGETLYCHGCHIHYDIFTLANQVEDYPSSGVDFYIKTVPALAKKYGLELEETLVTEEQAQKGLFHKLVHQASLVLQEIGTTDLSQTRGLSDKTAKEYGILTVPSYQEFIQRVVGYKGATKDLLESALDFKPTVFGPRCLTITIHDPSGNPVGFAARNFDYERGTSHSKKYDSTRSTSIYVKGNCLYGYHKAKKQAKHKLFVIESQLDCALLHQAGLHNVVAIQGSSITPGQLTLIEKLAPDSVVLFLDNDKAGIQSTLKIIEDSISGKMQIRISVLKYPDGVSDPADFLSKLGVTDIIKADVVSSFDYNIEHLWKTRQPDTEEEVVELSDKMAKVIASEPSHFRRQGMAKTLAKLSNFPLSTVHAQIEACASAKTTAFQSQMERINRTAVQSLQRTDGLGLVHVLREKLEQAEEIYSAFSQDDNTRPTQMVVDVLDGIQNPGSNKTRPAYLSTGHSHFDMTFGGIPASGLFVGVLARSSSGKSSLLVDIIPRLLAANPNLLVLFHTLDDPIQVVMQRMVSNVSSLSSSIILNTRRSHTDQAKVMSAAAHINALVKNGRLDIRDGNFGYSLTYAEQWAKSARDRNPDRQILYVCDSLYDTFIDKSDGRAKIETALTHLKVRICQKLGVGAICTIEPRKTYDDRARLTKEDCKESSKIELSAHALWIVHNGVPPGRISEIPEETRRAASWTDSFGDEQPILEVEIAKDKTHGPGIWRLEFSPSCTQLRSISCTRGTPKMMPIKRPASGFSV